MNHKPIVGVVVGRFQTPLLHEGHRQILCVASKTDALFVVLGVSGGCSDQSDPLDFVTRKLTIQEAFPAAVIAKLYDHSSDEEWSRRLDELIEAHFPEHQATLFGSRDSFIASYCGKFTCELVPEVPHVCSTDLRSEMSAAARDSVDFRAGVIYATTTQIYPTSFQAVDIVIRHTLENRVLVGRKRGENGWRFLGGFVDPTDLSLEHAARREVREEVGDIEIDDIDYIGSFRVDDHRYRRSKHKIMSALFVASYIHGLIRASDDLDEVRWQDFDGLVDCMVGEHRPLARGFLDSISTRR